MKTKICVKCNEEKVLKAFYFRKDNNSYLNECIECCLNDKKEFHKTFPWKQTLKNIKKRCFDIHNKCYNVYGGRGIQCLITEAELKELWFRDKAYEMVWPSIDRKNNEGDYIFENCQWLEHAENTAKNKRKPIFQYDLQGNFIKEWESATTAARTLNYQQSDINRNLTGKRNRKSAYGFIWRYK
jgi:hypothetical protein